MQTRDMYLHFTRSNIWAITKILVAGRKHASFLCYSMGARWFLRLNVVHATRRVFRPAEKNAEKKNYTTEKKFIYIYAN